tara:strand:+ start:220 stop:516 length:297 start_codon:yes stop_codon:yes gene_type:complete
MRRIRFEKIIIVIFAACSFLFFSGQTYYNNYDVNSIMKKLNDLDIILSEINEIKSQIKYGFKVNGGYVEQVISPVKVNGGVIDRVNNSVDCICYQGKK